MIPFLLTLCTLFTFIHGKGLKTATTTRITLKQQTQSNSDGRICAMSNDKTEPSKEELIWCTEYSENSCCSAAEDKALMNEFDRYWRSTAGHCPGCLTNVKAFQCGYTCSPSQADFTTVKRKDGNGTVIGATLRMCSQFCNSFHTSCGNITVAEMEGENANAFCQGFVDSAKGLTIELNQYDCYNSPAAPNRCDGERFGEIEKPGTNWFFITSCFLLGIICTTLIVSVLCYTGKPKEPKYEQDFVKADNSENAPFIKTSDGQKSN